VRHGIASFPPFLEANPYRRLLYGELTARGFPLVPTPRLRLRWLWSERRSVGFLHFHWPEGYWRHDRGRESLRVPLSYVRLCLFGARLLAARALGYRIVWTIHQVYPHERGDRRLDLLAARLLARFSRLLIAHDESTAEAARAELGLGSRSIEIVPHASYVGVYPPGRSRREVREEMGLGDDHVVFLSFGNLRAYKQLDLLLEAFGASSLPRAALVVAGEVSDPPEGERVLAAAAADPRVRPLLRRVDDDRVAELFAASDVAVLPRSDGGTSGALILALSLGLPVVAARAQVAEELTDGGRAGWLFEPGDAASLRAALEGAAAAGAPAKRHSAQLVSWPEAAERIAALLRG
jgi:beta-1,4-mannosyltransferase